MIEYQFAKGPNERKQGALHIDGVQKELIFLDPLAENDPPPSPTNKSSKMLAIEEGRGSRRNDDSIRSMKRQYESTATSHIIAQDLITYWWAIEYFSLFSSYSARSQTFNF